MRVRGGRSAAYFCFVLPWLVGSVSSSSPLRITCIIRMARKMIMRRKRMPMTTKATMIPAVVDEFEVLATG